MGEAPDSRDELAVSPECKVVRRVSILIRGKSTVMVLGFTGSVKQAERSAKGHRIRAARLAGPFPASLQVKPGRDPAHLLLLC